MLVPVIQILETMPAPLKRVRPMQEGLPPGIRYKEFVVGSVRGNAVLDGARTS